MAARLTALVITAIIPVFSSGCAVLQNVFREPGTHETCQDWQRIYHGPYILNNNVWGKCSADDENCISNYHQCIRTKWDAGKLVLGWSWRWPVGTEDRVKASPGIVFGWKPWDIQSSTPSLPRRLSDLKKLSATYEASVVGTGNYNVAFDLWFTGSPQPSPAARTHEVMIWVNASNWRGRMTGTPVLIGGETYEFHRGSVENGHWTYLVFFKASPLHAGSIPLHDFISYLMENGHVTGEDYLASIEFLTEIKEGSGRVEISRYSISIE